MTLCPCGSGLGFASCCEPYITKKSSAPDALALMRSRYSAYATGAVDYIVDTCADGTEGVDREATRRWAEGSEWLGLRIVRSELGGEPDETGTVEFVATFVQGGLKDDHHEIAKFIKKEGLWLYTEGEIIPETITRAEPKVGRNDPCPCGSGRKYKKCHGA
jgi:SEC-C motif-containing protein